MFCIDLSLLMEDILDTDEMIKRFKDRAAAVKTRDLPPVEVKNGNDLLLKHKLIFKTLR